jgi:hypothetical protein
VSDLIEIRTPVGTVAAHLDDAIECFRHLRRQLAEHGVDLSDACDYAVLSSEVRALVVYRRYAPEPDRYEWWSPEHKWRKCAQNADLLHRAHWHETPDQALSWHVREIEQIAEETLTSINAILKEES